MKGNVYIVSKTHLDLGYTNLAKRVLEKYMEQYIPKAIEVAKEVNKDGRKFIWTLGSWLIDAALKDEDKSRAKALEDACMRGDIVAHAMPFTIQSELADMTLFEDGLKIVKELDKKFNRNTISAKMTDVPGHTIGIVPLLAKYGIKLLHIGVNKSSAIPDVPPCFVWQSGDSQVVVIYEGSYGKTFMHPLLEDVLVFDHSMDNCGPSDAKKTLKHFNKIKRQFKDYNVMAGTLDDIAEKLWQIKDSLPVVEQEIGDSWIHGISSDPYKYGAVKMLEDMRSEWLRKKLISPDSEAYKTFSSNLLCLIEHTAGRGILNAFRDYDNYLKPDFLEARKADAKIKRYGIFRLPFLRDYMAKKSGKGRYSRMEMSWAEQREYITKAIEALPMKLYREAAAKLRMLRPKECTYPEGKELGIGSSIKCGKWKMEINGYGAPKNLLYNNKYIIKDNTSSLVDYKSIGPEEYDYWLEHYQRDLWKNFTWAIPDFGRPKLKKVAKYYPQGVFPYNFVDAVYDKTADFERITVKLAGKKQVMPQLGMPRNLTVQYIFYGESMQLRLEWTDKDVSRLPEEIWLHLGISPEQNDIIYRKLGVDVNPYNVVPNGGRNLSVTEHIDFAMEGKKYRLVPAQSIPVSLGRGKLLRFDNVFEDSKEGISFLLENNIWGTNYPLWYEDNASMWFDLAPISEIEKGIKFYQPKLKLDAIPSALKKSKYDDLEEKPDLSGKNIKEDGEKKKANTKKKSNKKDIIEEPFDEDDEPKIMPSLGTSSLGRTSKLGSDDIEIGKDGKIVEPQFDDEPVKISVAPRQRGVIDFGHTSDTKIEEPKDDDEKPKLSIKPRTNRFMTLQSDENDEDILKEFKSLVEPKDEKIEEKKSTKKETKKSTSSSTSKKSKAVDNAKSSQLKSTKDKEEKALKSQKSEKAASTSKSANSQKATKSTKEGTSTSLKKTAEKSASKTTSNSKTSSKSSPSSKSSKTSTNSKTKKSE